MRIFMVLEEVDYRKVRYQLALVYLKGSKNIIINKKLLQFLQRGMLSEAQKTILGIMIVKFATGFTGDWGVISLYILSFYHYYGAPV